jgi:serine/threonine protein kinase
MSPEAFRKSTYSEKSDMWAVGLTFLEMMSGSLPFEGLEYDQMVKSIAGG